MNYILFQIQRISHHICSK